MLGFDVSKRSLWTAAMAVLVTTLSTAEPSEAACVVFHEGNNCTQNRSSCCTNSGRMNAGCWSNDEARSMTVHGEAGTVVSVFDHSRGSTSDDSFVVIKGDDSPMCVTSFESPSTSGGQASDWFYSGGNGLDGKVSYWSWTDPR